MIKRRKEVYFDVSCYHPQTAVVLGLDPVTGKKKLKFLGADVVASVLYPDKEVLQVPCGQCIGCRIDRSRQWANRCMLELQYQDGETCPKTQELD